MTVSSRDTLIELVEVLQDQIQRVTASRDFYARQLADLGADYDAALDRIDWLEHTNRVLTVEVRKYQQTKDRRGLRTMLLGVAFVGGSLFDALTGYGVTEGLDEVRGLNRATAEAQAACDPGTTQIVSPSGIPSGEQFGTPTVQPSPVSGMGEHIPDDRPDVFPGRGSGATIPSSARTVPQTVTPRGGGSPLPRDLTADEVRRRAKDAQPLSNTSLSVDNPDGSQSFVQMYEGETPDEAMERAGLSQTIDEVLDTANTPERHVPQQSFFPMPNRDTGSFITLAPNEADADVDAVEREWFDPGQQNAGRYWEPDTAVDIDEVVEWGVDDDGRRLIVDPDDNRQVIHPEDNPASDDDTVGTGVHDGLAPAVSSGGSSGGFRVPVRDHLGRPRPESKIERDGKNAQEVQRQLVEQERRERESSS